MSTLVLTQTVMPGPTPWRLTCNLCGGETVLVAKDYEVLHAGAAAHVAQHGRDAANVDQYLTKGATA